MRVVFLGLLAASACNNPPSATDASVEAGEAFINCATTEPTINTPCTEPGYVCEYGDDLNTACNELRICETYAGETKWVRGLPTPQGICPSTPAISPSCPSSSPSGACSSDGGALCEYPQGFCICDVNDSGVNWRCEDQLGCPQPRPRFGAACASEGQTCDYLACFVAWGAKMTCMGGVWRPGTLCQF